MALSSVISNQLREWAPLTALFQKLPTKAQSGLFTQEIKLTCIDILPEFIALGSNLGIVYWFNRKTGELERLRCEKGVAIDVIKILSTVDYMVACGGKDGNINIFQIPKAYPDSLPENLKPKNKQVERYTVSELHKNSITALEWSKNGMKLFSGDKNGCVVQTEIDFYMHLCKSMEILNETYEVVQISYNQQKLLVSTTYRSIICQRSDKWNVCQVGKKDRKILGQFGGIIYQKGIKSSDILLYCSRPGLRIWIADTEGNVQKTLLFKELLSKECIEVPIINPISKKLKSLKPQKEASFGVLLSFYDNMLVTYSNDIIYILDTEKMTVLYTLSQCRNVLSVATHKDEIFILEGNRSVIRIGFMPESNENSNWSNLPNLSNIIPSSIKDLTHKLQSTNIVPALSPFIPDNDVNIHIDESIIVNAEEAKESAFNVSISPNIISEIDKKFDNIGKQEFDDKILFKHEKRKKLQSLLTTSMNSLSSNSSDDKDLNITKPTLMTISSISVLPDLRSPETIKNDIESKEKLLANILDFDQFKISLDADEINKPTDENNLKKKSTDICESNINVEEYNINYTTQKYYPLQKNKINNEPPECLNIPTDWKLSNIELCANSKKNSDSSELSDWEVV